MPLLPAESFVYPDELFPVLRLHSDVPIGPSRCEPSRWWVLHTKPRAEKALARRLTQRQIPFFLPLYRRQWRQGGRAFCAHLPLFPGYLFIHGDGEARLHALETNQVVRTLHVEDQLQFGEDLYRVYQLVVSGQGLAPEDRLTPGTRVEIVSGPLAGVEGTILGRNNKLRFRVEVRFLQQGVSVDIEGWMIRPIGVRVLAAG